MSFVVPIKENLKDIDFIAFIPNITSTLIFPKYQLLKLLFNEIERYDNVNTNASATPFFKCEYTYEDLHSILVDAYFRIEKSNYIEFGFVLESDYDFYTTANSGHDDENKVSIRKTNIVFSDENRTDSYIS